MLIRARAVTDGTVAMSAPAGWTDAGELLRALPSTMGAGDPYQTLWNIRGSAWLCDTTPAMEIIGMRALPVMVTYRHLATMLGSGEDDLHLHGLDPGAVASLGELLARPAAIMDAHGRSSRADAVMFLLDEVDDRGDPIVAVVRPNGQSPLGKFGPVVESNHLCSAYGRRDVDYFLENMRRERKLLYIDGERLESLDSKSYFDVAAPLEGLKRDCMLQPSAVMRACDPVRGDGEVRRHDVYHCIVDELRRGVSFYAPERGRYLLSLMRDGRGDALVVDVTVEQIGKAIRDFGASVDTDDLVSGEGETPPIGRTVRHIAAWEDGLLRSAAKEMAAERWIPVNGDAASLVRASRFLLDSPRKDERSKGLAEIEKSARRACEGMRAGEDRALPRMENERHGEEAR